MTEEKTKNQIDKFFNVIKKKKRGFIVTDKTEEIVYEDWFKEGGVRRGNVLRLVYERECSKNNAKTSWLDDLINEEEYNRRILGIRKEDKEMSLKVGDKVRLKEGLVVGNFYSGVVYMDVKRFKGTEIVKKIDEDGDITLVGCKNKWLYSLKMLEKVEEQTLKEKYLVDSNVVKTRNGDIYLITKNALTGLKNGHKILIYNEDLTCKFTTAFDIVEVFERKESVYMLSDLVDSRFLTSIWKRKELPEISELEYHILKNVNDKWVQIARDDNGSLYLYDKEEVFEGSYGGIDDGTFYSSFGDKVGIRDYLFKEEVFKNITFESGVLQVKDLIEKYEKENK